MKRGRIKADPSGPRFNDIGGETIDIAVSRHARLLGASALAGGVLRGLAIAAGMVTALGASPVFAQCASSATDLNGAGSCAATAATGTFSTAVGFNANATGVSATAYGNGAVANGGAATATGSSSVATGLSATATGQSSTANGSNATATGQNSIANGANATATGRSSFANGDLATATGQ